MGLVAGSVFFSKMSLSMMSKFCMMFSFSMSSPMSYEKEIEVKKSSGSWYLEGFCVCLGMGRMEVYRLMICFYY
jgi:hypothetical protein